MKKSSCSTEQIEHFQGVPGDGVGHGYFSNCDGLVCNANLKTGMPQCIGRHRHRGSGPIDLFFDVTPDSGRQGQRSEVSAYMQCIYICCVQSCQAPDMTSMRMDCLLSGTFRRV